MRRTDWLTCNAREAALITGCDDPQAAAAALVQASREGLGRLEASREGSGPRSGVLVRTGQEPIVINLDIAEANQFPVPFHPRPNETK